jgi:hypothetical protein
MNIRSFFRGRLRYTSALAGMFFFVWCLPTLHGNAGKYASIVKRNPFGLKPEVEIPLKTAEKPPAPAPAPPLLILTGLTKFRGSEKAYFVDPTGRTYEQKYLVLSPGGRSGDLVLVAVDFRNRSVRLQYQGRELSLSMKQNDMASFLAKPRMGGEPQSIAYENVRQRRVPRSSVLASAFPVAPRR